MKLSFALFFLTILLLCGLMLRAANHDRKLIRVENVKQEITKVQVTKDMELVPNIILL